MPAAQMDIKVDQGATFGMTLIIYLDAAETQLRNLTGYKARMAIRKNYTTLSPLWSNTNLPVGGANGQIGIRIEEAVTKTFDPGKYVYDVELEDPLGTVERVLAGVAIISAEATK